MIKFFLPVFLFFILLAGGKIVNAQDNPNKDGDVYRIVEEMPVFPGGEVALRKFIAENVNYPDDAKKEGISGKVYISFVIDENGDVIRAKVVRGVSPSLDKESLRVVNSSLKWQPGKEKGKVVKVAYTIPINFALN